MLNQTILIDRSAGNGEQLQLKTQLLRLHLIRCDAGTQSRAAINEEVVSEYAERMLDGEKFPPVVVFFDGNQYYLADGFHRFMAAHRNEFLDFECTVLQGTRTDALKHSLGANVGHGLRRTNADKRRAVELALAEWPQLSDREIARICAVHHTLAGSVRREQVAESATCPKTRQGADGKQYPVRQSAEHAKPNGNQVRESRTCEEGALEDNSVQADLNDEQLVTVTTSDSDEPQLSSDDSSVLPENQNCEEEPDQPTPANGRGKSRLSASSSLFAPPLDPSDDCIIAMGLTEGEPEELRARVEYHMELIKADMGVLLDRLHDETLEASDIVDAAKELKLAIRIFAAYADTLPQSQD